MLPFPDIVDKILDIIREYQPDIRQKFLENRTAATSAVGETHTSSPSSPHPATATALSTPVGHYKPRPLDGDIYGSSDTPIPPNIRHYPPRSHNPSLGDSGYYSGASALTHPNENVMRPSGPQWQTAQLELSTSHINSQAGHEPEADSWVNWDSGSNTPIASCDIPDDEPDVYSH